MYDTLVWFSWACPRSAWKQEAEGKVQHGDTGLRSPASVPAGSWLGWGVPGGHAAALAPGFRVTTCKGVGLVGSSVLLDLNFVLLEPLLDF